MYLLEHGVTLGSVCELIGNLATKELWTCIAFTL